MQDTKPTVDSAVQAVYLDFYGPIAPTDFITGTVEETAKANAVIQDRIFQRTGVEPSDLSDMLSKGKELTKQGKKDDPLFKTLYVPALDEALKVGLQEGVLKMPVYSDAMDAVKSLQDVPTYILCTGLPDTTQLSLVNAVLFGDNEKQPIPLDQYIAGIYSTDTWGSKQKAETYTKVLEDKGISASAAVFVSDTTQECIAAMKAGIGHVFYIDRAESPVLTQEMAAMLREAKVPVVTSMDAVVEAITHKAYASEQAYMPSERAAS